MYENVVVGIDGRQGGRDALALARLLCADAGKLTLVHATSVTEGVEAVITGARHPAEEGRELLESMARGIGGHLHVVERSTINPIAALCDVARERDADLVVVGSSAAQHAGRVRLGDHARRALHEAPCAVAVAPREYATAPRRLRRIGAGYDERPAGADALQTARALAEGLGAELHALQVIDQLPSPWTPTPVAYYEVLTDATGRETRRARARLANMGGLEAHVEAGRPVAALRRFSNDVDLLVLGSRGRGPLECLVLGSTSEELVRHAACPVLVLPRPSRSSSDVPGSVVASSR